MSEASPLRASDFDYELPPEAIAQTPPRLRDSCRLAVVDRAARRVRHVRFRDLDGFLRPGDLLVLNDSKVLPARIPVRRASGGNAELFLLEPLASGPLPVFLRPAGRIKLGEALAPLQDPEAGAFVLEQRRDDGVFLFEWRGKRPWSQTLLDKLGLPPLPHYIHRERLPAKAVAARDKLRYQTVYARLAGSVAAPTAGLHFTTAMLDRLRAKGVECASVTLHVGAGTFQPVKSELLRDHPMHTEACEVPPETAKALADCRKRGSRVIAVGTTALRTLESCAQADGSFSRGWIQTRLFIMPGYRFKCVDGLITNFHQPRSTLLPLVAAFWDREGVRELYRDCLERGYRFLSYGDACFFQ
ncbi:MAG TPA: tRNA preQ1(34) S-adenosylmethionine ribosyltransferase-isomerase QueA [bacterium]|jgi:S-adenosylmethionine:tRNA ribosyltransferase-isomerase|nr:tRNA preQ1(34) S-adenosylmethionine ribosyltransferase-isomerase QueA [bacterium]